MASILKYPRTHHVESSRFQPGDEELEDIPFSRLAGRRLVVEEKVDGANAGISFAADGTLLLQSRGHYLTGGYRERHFSLFKAWANTHKQSLYNALGQRYLLFGEWLYAKHTIFYTDLPHYFLEFDLFDKESNRFLDTKKRALFRERLSFIEPVKVLFSGKLNRLVDLVSMAGRSHFIRDHHFEVLESVCKGLNLDSKRVKEETDPSQSMEGLYIKVEEDGIVKERLKWIRPSFLTAVLQADSHWLDRPIVPNQLRPGVEIFA